MSAVPQQRMLACVRCAQPFPYKGAGKPGKYCSDRCRAYVRPPAARPAAPPRLTVVALPLEPARPCNDPRRGDLIKSGDEYRLVVERVHTAAIVELVVFKVLPLAEEHTVRLDVWRSWCAERNATPGCVVELVCSREGRAS